LKKQENPPLEVAPTTAADVTYS